MRFNVTDKLKPCSDNLVVGNVYNVRGGSGSKYGHLHVVISVRETGTTTITIDRDGYIVGGGNYGRHYLEEKTPVAFVEGLEDLTFNMVSI